MPIHHAAGTVQLEICKFIHERGDNLNPLTNNGKTPLKPLQNKKGQKKFEVPDKKAVSFLRK